MALRAAVRRLLAPRRQLLCRAAVELMTEYLEGVLSGPAQVRFETHLEACAACRAYLSQMRATIAAVGHLQPDRLPADVLDELVGLYRRFHR